MFTNSGIANNAFYLAVGAERIISSGVSVQELGVSRVQIERVFYRAFAQLMPRNGTFAMAGSFTLQAATDLYGANSHAYRAVRDAWTAVGVADERASYVPRNAVAVVSILLVAVAGFADSVGVIADRSTIWRIRRVPRVLSGTEAERFLEGAGASGRWLLVNLAIA